MPDQKLIANLDPVFIPKVRALKLALLKQTGYEWCACQGRRTIAEQDALYAQGRTTPGKIVTRAKGGSSAHNFGLAVDMVPVKDNDLWWDAPKDLFKQAADIAGVLGFTPGFYFTTIYDPDHFEDPRWREKQALWKVGKLEVL